MELHEQIRSCYQASKNYPELVKALIETGILSYTVDVATGTILYRLAGGINSLHESVTPLRQIHPGFDRDQTLQAIKNNQQGKTTYPEFMEGIAKAGVRFYEATLNGSSKRVTYIGSGGHYEELIPV